MDFVLNVLQSWQVQTVVGLVILDVLLGVAAALRTGQFEVDKLANYYRTAVVPYVIGYVALFTVVGYVIPKEALDSLTTVEGLGDILNEVVVDAAWVTLLVTIGKSIVENFSVLYSGVATKKVK